MIIAGCILPSWPVSLSPSNLVGKMNMGTAFLYLGAYIHGLVAARGQRQRCAWLITLGSLDGDQFG